MRVYLDRLEARIGVQAAARLVSNSPEPAPAPVEQRVFDELAPAPAAAPSPNEDFARLFALPAPSPTTPGY